MLKGLLKERRWLVISVLVFFAVAILMDFLTKPSSEVQSYAELVEQYLHVLEKEAEDNIRGGDISIRNFIRLQNNIDEESDLSAYTDKLSRLSSRPYSISVYQKDSLVYWTNNMASPPENVLAQACLDSVFFTKLSNGYYVVKKRCLEEASDTFSIYSLIPVKYNYPIETEYLSNRFAVENASSFTNLEEDWTDYIPFGMGTSLPKEIDIAQNKEGVPIQTLDGLTLFHLTANDTFTGKGQLYAVVGLYLIAFLLLIYLLSIIGRKLAGTDKPWLGVSFLVLSLLVVRGITYAFQYHDKFGELSFFKRLFNGSFLTYSLGDLIINIFLAFWIGVFFHRYFKLPNISTSRQSTKMLWVSSGYLSIMLGLLGITGIVRNMVLDSGIPFDFENIFSLDSSSFVSVIGIMVLLVVLFLFTHRISFIIADAKLDLYERLACLGIASALMIPISSYGMGLSWDQVWQLILFSIIYIVSFDIFVENEKANFTWMVVWLVIFSLFSSYLIYRFNIEKEKMNRLELAQKLALGRDVEMEGKLGALANQILIDGSSLTTVKDKNKLAELIERNYAIDLRFSDYDYQLSAFYKNSQSPLLNEEGDFKEIQLQLNQARETSKGNVKYLRPENYLTNYIVNLDIPIQGAIDENLLLILHFKRRQRQSTRVYAALFANERQSIFDKLSDYDYAIYQKGEQVDKFTDNKITDFGNTLKMTLVPDKGNYAFQELIKDNRSELLYHDTNGTVVIIAKKLDEALRKWASLFCYLFTILIGVLVILILLNALLRILPNNVEVSFTPAPSLRNRIQFYVISIIIFTFILIALFTVSFNNNDQNVYHSKRSQRKSEAALKDARLYMRLLDITPDSTKRMTRLAKDLSKIHKMDINVYDLDGFLIASSEDDVFKRGLVEPRMSGEAFLKLLRQGKDESLEEERVGNLIYNSTYVPVTNEKDELVAYFGLPYYSKQTNLREDTSAFMSSLLNLYVFLLIIAGAIAIFIANSITRPLSVIGEKLKLVKIGKRNEPLEWSTQDELGDLIAEYNKMIVKLENSAQLLASSERESAWREMAKQVAHEIKNPLTPMKLSIQYLQHAYRSNPENIEPMLKRVSHTLIEQIDNLSQIATEFSNFAKMPRAENEKFPINQLVSSVYDLFSEREDMDITLEIQNVQDYFIFADKNQLMRVFNNLIKNAIQAIPDDRKGNIQVYLSKNEEDMAVVEVQDNGVGIPEKMREFVFVPNFTTKNSGTGLGLAISKSIIDSLEGNIYFETKVDVGTRFYVEIPLVKEEEIIQESIEV